MFEEASTPIPCRDLELLNDEQAFLSGDSQADSDESSALELLALCRLMGKY